MSKGRLEAFSDGVIAIIITIMVLELRAPHEADLHALEPLFHEFLSYVLSFVFVGIYWSNHHHLFQAVKHVRGGVLWANLHLLFWLSLIPFTTSWMGEHPKAAWPVALYGGVLIACAIAYTLLVRLLVAHHPADSALVRAVGSDAKGHASLAIYALGLLAAFYQPLLAKACYVVVAVLWLVPDRRIERAMAETPPS
jgi:uncharacterized membrane protein